MQASALFLLVSALLAGDVYATGRPQSNQTIEHLLAMIESSRPVGIDPAYDCSWRKLASEYAPKIQPWLDASHGKALFDALELGTMCKQEFDASLYAGTGRVPVSASDAAIFVSPKGSDDNSGSMSSPLATLAAAVTKTRAASSPKAIMLRAGTYYLAGSVVLTPKDNGLNISAYNGENVTVSGGRSLTLEWNTTSHPTNGKTVFVADVSKFDLPQGIQALQFDGKRATLARFPNANPELDLFPAGYITAKTTCGGCGRRTHRHRR